MMLLDQMTDLEKDILRELMNIIMAKAGDSFAKLSKQEVFISVPRLLEIKKETALAEMFQSEQVEVIIQSEIKGDLYAHTLLFFSADDISLFEAVCFRGKHVNEAMKQSLLLEISNILTGTIVSYLADILKVNIYGSVPSDPIYRESVKEEQLLLDLDLSRPVLFTINTSFCSEQSHTNMTMVFILDEPNFRKVLETVRTMNKKELKFLIK